VSTPEARRGVDWTRILGELDRLNRILIPKTKAEKERFRGSRSARFFHRATHGFERLTEEGQAFLAISTLSFVLALDALRSQLYVAWAVMTALLVASFAVSGLMRLSSVMVKVLAPRRVTVGDEATLSVVLHNEGSREHVSLRVRGSLMTWDARWAVRAAGVARLAPGARETVTLRLRFGSRGAHVIDPVGVRALVPLGLVLGPPTESDAIRLLVVPKIAKIASLSLPTSRRHHRGGVPRASRTADARELAGVRPYRIGDPVRDLHARTWARVGEPVVREHREEYFARVGVVLDTDLALATPAHFEAAVSLVAGVVARVMGTESLVDVMVLGRTVHSATLGRHLGSLDTALDVLATADPEGPFDGDSTFAQLRPHLTRLSAVILIGVAWDDARRAMASRIDAAGTPCAAYVIGAGEDEPGVRHLDAEVIARGDEVRL
jgi:uncharacterized protein (DUF58 family)